MAYVRDVRQPFAIVSALTLRRRVHLLHPDLGNFLFASVGVEIEGIPLSVISALECLGLDPWEEAVRLSSLSRREAAEQLARLIVELPGNCHLLAAAREIARPLVALLPNRGTMPRVVSQIQVRPRFCGLAASLRSPYWIVFGVLTAAAVFSAIAHRGFEFLIGSP